MREHVSQWAIGLGLSLFLLALCAPLIGAAARVVWELLTWGWRWAW